MPTVRNKISRKDALFLKKVGDEAFNNFSYSKAIKIFEKYNKSYDLDEYSLYQLGMLYDHLGQAFRFGSGVQKNRKKSTEHFNKAIEIFKSILKKNPKSYNALYGIGKVFRNKGNYKKALLYSKRAYRLNKAVGAKAVYGIGFIYELMGNYKQAELWYRKDIQDKGIDDYGANMNLLTFLNRRHKVKNRQLAQTVKKHFDKEPKSYRNSVVGKAIEYEIDMVLNPNKPK